MAGGACENEGCPTPPASSSSGSRPPSTPLQPGADPVLRASDRADFQANGALPLGKAVGRPPRQVAEEVVAAASLDDICAEVEVSGPGFINLTLSDDLRGRAWWRACRPTSGWACRPAARPETVVIDYSAPNVAKEMHVGHLRSTLIGDALARVLGFLGPRRAPGEPHRRLGHALRHAHRAPARRRRRGQRRVLQRAGPQRVLRRGAPAVRQRPGLRRALPQPRRAAAGRRRRDAAPLAHLRGRVHAPRRPRSTSCSASC